MSGRYTADFRVIVSVSFEDDETHDIRDQAFDALWDVIDQNGCDVTLIDQPQEIAA